MAEKRIREHEDRVLEIMQSEEQRKQKNNKKSLTEILETIKHKNIALMREHKRKQRDKRTGKYLNK